MNILKDRQQKSIVILVESFFLIAMPIFKIIFNKFDLIRSLDLENVTSQIFHLIKYITKNSLDY